jgi:hypothetical protein
VHVGVGVDGRSWKCSCAWRSVRWSQTPIAIRHLAIASAAVNGSRREESRARAPTNSASEIRAGPGGPDLAQAVTKGAGAQSVTDESDRGTAAQTNAGRAEPARARAACDAPRHGPLHACHQRRIGPQTFCVRLLSVAQRARAASQQDPRTTRGDQTLPAGGRGRPRRSGASRQSVDRVLPETTTRAAP